MIVSINSERQNSIRQQHSALFAVQRRYLTKTGLIAGAILLYYIFFFIYSLCMYQKK